MTKTLLRKVLFTTSLFLVTLVPMEVAVRFWGYSEHHIYDPIYMPFAQTKDIPYIHKPNLVNVRACGMAIINTDSLGLRARVRSSYLWQTAEQLRSAMRQNIEVMLRRSDENAFSCRKKDVIDSRPGFLFRISICLFVP
jgi:hypothetical protein